MEGELYGTPGYYSSSNIGSSSSPWYAMQVMITADDHAMAAPPPLSPPPPPPSLLGYSHLLAPPQQAEQLLSGASPSDAASINCKSTSGAGCGGEKEEQVSSAIRAKIASHPLYPQLVHAYIDCQKVGAPPEIAGLLDEIRVETSGVSSLVETCFGADPELDDFMETYRDILVKYKADLSRPFDEATSFLKDIEAQFNSLCNCTPLLLSDESGGSSDECLSGGDAETADPYRPREDQDLKHKLMSKYSGYICSLKHEFCKSKKKGKLPKEARQILLDWWNIHYKWPYPTESDKLALVDATGLDQKQINNWFINQRKRHWKPTEKMHFSVVDTTIYMSSLS